ncbi:MAG: methyltransferase domain-containing protein [Nanoarchaeota archaeon]
MKNPNDATAEVFDAVYRSFHNEPYYLRELKFIQSFFKPQAKLLDLGCGTGRHLVPLARAGYQMTGADSSIKMLEILRSKLKENHLQADVVESDAASLPSFTQSFDGVICFWNSFCEMATTQERALKIFESVYQSLKKGGIFILEQSNPETFNPSIIEYHSRFEDHGKSYETFFHVLSYSPETHTSVSDEKILVREKNKPIKTLQTTITQRWWREKDLRALCAQAGFTKIAFYGGDFTPFQKPTDKLILVAKK